MERIIIISIIIDVLGGIVILSTLFIFIHKMFIFFNSRTSNALFAQITNLSDDDEKENSEEISK